MIWSNFSFLFEKLGHVGPNFSFPFEKLAHLGPNFCFPFEKLARLGPNFAFPFEKLTRLGPNDDRDINIVLPELASERMRMFIHEDCPVTQCVL